MDLGSLRKVVEDLEAGLSVVSDDAWFYSQSLVVQNTLRAGVIKQFCLAYDVSCKMIQRWAKLHSADATQIDTSSFQQLLCVVANKGLVADVETWLDYRALRHTIAAHHDNRSAQQVLAKGCNFIGDFRALLRGLEAHEH